MTKGRWGLYFGALAVLSIFLAGRIFGFGFQWFSEPMTFARDGILELAMVQNGLENPWYVHGTRLGYPEGFSLVEYPFVAAVHFVFLKAFWALGASAVQAMNIYYLLTFPLAACAMAWVLVLLSVPRAFAFAGGILYAFLHCHLVYGTWALWLSAYYAVPLLLPPLLWVCDGPKASPAVFGPRGRRMFSLAVGILIGCGDLYYSYFSLLILLFAFVMGVHRWGWKQASTDAAWIGVPILGFMLINLGPSIIHLILLTPSSEHVLFRRDPQHTDKLFLALIPLLLGRKDHPVEGWATFASDFLKSSGISPEHSIEALGLIGSLGVLYMIYRGLFVRGDKPVDWISYLVLCILLFAAAGGPTTLMTFLFSSPIRYNLRLVVFVGAFALAAAALWISPWSMRQPDRILRGLTVILIAFGFWDQAASFGRDSHQTTRKDVEENRVFFSDLEKRLPPGSAIFQLPIISFPEGFSREILDPYFHQIPYVLTRSLRFSSASIRGRAWENEARVIEFGIQHGIQTGNPREFSAYLAKIASRGFRGILTVGSYMPSWIEDFEREMRVAGAPPAMKLSNRDFRYFELPAGPPLGQNVSLRAELLSLPPTPARRDVLLIESIKATRTHVSVRGSVLSSQPLGEKSRLTLVLHGTNGTFSLPTIREARSHWRHRSAPSGDARAASDRRFHALFEREGFPAGRYDLYAWIDAPRRGRTVVSGEKVDIP